MGLTTVMSALFRPVVEPLDAIEPRYLPEQAPHAPGYHDPGWRPTVIQSTDHLVGPTEQFGRSVDITAGQMLADPRRRRHLAADRDHSDLDAVHSGDRTRGAATS